MRLMPENGEAPMDKYVRHKENIQDWYDEMERYGLTDEEVKVVEKHLKSVYGVASSQEEMMLMLMDENIGGFSVSDADFARKVVGKKLMDKIPKVKEMLFEGTGVNG